jgi:uncharacterized protein involved in exopolysaccharide biosynthesis
MEEDIDLRKYIVILVRHWYWIIGLGVLAAVAAYVVTTLSPASYEAASLILFTNPPIKIQLDERLETTQPVSARELARDYGIIAAGDDVLQAVARDAAFLTPEERGMDYLRSVLRINEDKSSGQTSSSLISLQVTSDDADKAVRLANLWADKYVDWVNALYSQADVLTSLEAEQATAKSTMEEADQALAGFRRDYGMGVIDSFGQGTERTRNVGLLRQLESRSALLGSYEARAVRITQLLEEARALEAQVGDSNSPAILSGLLADMLALGLSGDSTLPVQISLAGLDPKAGLSAIVTALQAKRDTTGTTIAQLVSEVSRLQAEAALRQQQLDQLLRDYNLASKTYAALAGRVQEMRIMGDQKVVRVVSRASAPVESLPRRLVNAATAGLLGAIVGALAALAAESWRAWQLAEPEPHS